MEKKAKLVKAENGYGLEGVDIIAFYSSKRPEHNYYKLSKKNCDEIFGLVDVEKLAEEELQLNATLSPKAFKRGVKLGLNKAMELNKDKVFTEQDIINAMNRVWEWTENEKDIECSSMTELRKKHLQSLQQPTEIEVTFNTEEKDSDGCLILKRVA